jgi:hypothetical protein
MERLSTKKISARRPAQLLAAQDVEVQMRDALSAPIARIHHHSEAVFLKTQLLHQLRQDFLYVDQDIRGCREDVFRVFLGNHQNMHRCTRIQVR